MPITTPSHQSHPLTSRAELEQRIEDLKDRYRPETISRPDFWGGFVLQAGYYEFWQGRKSRLHDRISYTLEDKGWNISRLSP
jgi:pyridoxamine 5'-phosphate oxidase